MQLRFTPTVVVLLFGSFFVSVSTANGPKVIAEGKLPADSRLEPLKDLNGYFPFEVSESPKAWERRAEYLRRQTKVALGLWPEPTRTPLNAVVHGKIDQGEYTVEKVYFESVPGFYVTGNLYRPVGLEGKRPAVLCPHGHWKDARFSDNGEAAAKKQIEIGAEKFIENARNPIQARCVQLAKLGCVVFHYDMLGDSDSQQLSRELVHKFGKQRPEMINTTHWGLFSPQAESHLQSVMGLQTWNSIRALDFLETLPEVDSKRLAITGASGGGTQTFLLCAVDDRPAAALPAVMVSTAMQGGCTCENASLLRVGTGNVELAALFAPKPLALIAADDWTKEMSTKGFPELRQHYAMLKAADNVVLNNHIEFRHNYNAVNRKLLYSWFNEHLALGVETPIVEEEMKRLTEKDLTVWNDKHPQPKGGEKFERTLLQTLTADANKQLAALSPTDAKSLTAYRQVVGGAIDVVVGRGIPNGDDLEYEQNHKVEKEKYIEMAGVLTNLKEQEALPVVFLYPKQWNDTVVIWLHEKGKAGLYQKNGDLVPAVKKLVDEGVTVMGIDLLYQGEFLADGKPPEKNRKVENTREAASYTYGYNHALFAQRVHDVLAAISFVQSHYYEPSEVNLVGIGQAGPWAAAARAQAGNAVTRAVIDTAGFRFGEVMDIYGPDFLPGGAKYGDLPGILSLSAPDALWLAGEKKEDRKIIEAAYKAAGASDQLTIYDGDDVVNDAVKYLLKSE